MIDLHLHSTASDRALAPAALVRRAAAGGLAAIALTDHDTMDGVPAATEAGDRLDVRVIPGVEISLDHQPGTFHMIGLAVDPGNGPLKEALIGVRGGRDVRNRRLLDRLAEMGMPLTMEEVESHAGGEIVARPHFALAMRDRGYVSRLKEAFDRYIGKGAPAYEDRYRLSVEDAIRLVHEAGGVTILCHPATLGLDPGAGAGPGGELRAFVRRLAGLGLDAIEVRYSERDPAGEELRAALAADAGLLESGGSDFHGHTAKDRRQGVRRGNLDIPMDVLDRLLSRAEEHRRERDR